MQVSHCQACSPLMPIPNSAIYPERKHFPLLHIWFIDTRSALEVIVGFTLCSSIVLFQKSPLFIFGHWNSRGYNYLAVIKHLISYRYHYTFQDGISGDYPHGKKLDREDLFKLKILYFLTHSLFSHPALIPDDGSSELEYWTVVSCCMWMLGTEPKSQ